MEDRFKQLDSEFKHKDTVLSFFPSMFKVDEFMLEAIHAYQNYGLDALRNQLKSRGGIPEDYTKWLSNGVACEILSPGTKGWRKGKVRIKVTLEFCPDEPETEEILEKSNQLVSNQSESPLDDIRQMVNGNS